MRLIFALLILSAVFTAATASTEDSGQLGSGARNPAFGSGVGMIGSGT